MSWLRGAVSLAFSGVLAVAVAACGGDDDDGGDADAGYPEVTLDHCEFAPLPATGGAGGTVQAGPLMAGAAEAPLDVPVSTALGSYTSRAGFLGTAGKVDLRQTEINGSFNPSIGVETRSMVKALALSAGGETLLIIKVDLEFPYEGHTYELEQRLGPEFAGKILITVSHSHSMWGQYSGHAGIGGVGAGQVQKLVYDRFLDTYEDVARAALAARRPAKIGFALDDAFDPEDRINRDRRGENDEMSGGKRDDNMFFMIRVDGTDDVPIAALPIFGMHGTLQDDVNSFASTDAPGGVERMFQETFDNEVVVMHLQGIIGDVSPVGHGNVDCDNKPGNDGDPCWQWLKNEGNGREALPQAVAAWEAAGAAMQTEIALESMVRTVELGPNPQTFTIRDGALAYGVWDRYTEADRQVYDESGELLSPIDEFNAPVGAALCEEDYPIFPAGLMAGVDMLPPYGSCVTIDVAGAILSELLGLTFDAAEDKPVCQSTRTTVTAMRIGEYVIGGLPGEITTLIADKIRDASPVAPDKTIVIAFTNGEVGYLVTPEDWVLGGYEASINFWGPLEGEYLVEQLAPLMQMVMTPERENAAAGSAERFVTPPLTNQFTIDTPAGTPGTLPTATELEDVWTRTGPASQPQPAAQIERVSGIAQYVWIGDHPATGTPVVTLQQETSPGSFADVARRSGRPVQDGDLLLAYTPLPLRPDEGEARTHYWVVEWQAVPWIGSGALDSLDARVAVPVGTYRFHVEAPGYELFSDPFDVVPATLTVTAAVAGSEVSATSRVHADNGFRMLHTDLASNQPVPVRNGTFTVELTLSAGGPLTFTGVAGDGGGKVTVDAGKDAGLVTGVTVTDAYGNTGSATL